jgi:5-methylcytosine-specific restriction enzyme subunit McrC
MSKILIQNIYYLLCYAWDRLEATELIKTDTETSPNLPNLLTSVLIRVTQRLINQGLYQEYITSISESRSIKGKLLLLESLRKNQLNRGIAICEFDDFSVDNLPNQLLRTTLSQLASSTDLDNKLRKKIDGLLIKMTEVSQIDLTKEIFISNRFGHLSPNYWMALNICELICANLSFSQQTGRYLFQDFLKNEKKMASLFENFVRNFFKIELSEARPSREDIRWQFEGNNESLKLLPKMQTDVTLRYQNRKIIIDAKYYADTFQRNFDVKKIYSQHLYQLHAYLSQQSDPTCEGILLYPCVNEPVRLEFKYQSHRIKVETINLNQPWELIHTDMLALL